MSWFVRRELSNRWRAALGIALLVGLSGTVVLASAAGARRTSGVYERFIAATQSRDALIQLDLDNGRDDVIADIAALDDVAAVGEIKIFGGASDAVPEDVELLIVTSPDGAWGRDVDVPLVVRGRRPSEATADEVVASEVLADAAGLDLGDRITLTTFSPADLELIIDGNGGFPGFNGPELTLEIVGIGRLGSDVGGAEVGSGSGLYGTAALDRELTGTAGFFSGLVAVRLVPGADPYAIGDEIKPLVGAGAEYEVNYAAEDFGNSARNAATVLAAALWVFCAAAAAATAVAVGTTLSRQYQAGAAPAQVLAALGYTRRERALALSAVSAVGVVGGVLLALAGAIVVSSRFPVGLASAMEPDPGTRFDPVVLPAGATVLLVAAFIWMSFVSTRRDATPPTPASGQPTLIARAVEVLPPGPRLGIGGALGLGAGARRGSFRALAAAAVGVIGVIGAAGVIRSIDAMSEPARSGYSWQIQPGFVEGDDVDSLAGGLADTAGVVSVASRRTARVEVGGRVVYGVAFEPRKGALVAPLRSGRAPVSPDEIALGARTARDLGVGIGDTVRLRTRDDEQRPFSVVGIAVLAPEDTQDPSVGALLTPEGIDVAERSNGYTTVVAAIEPGADRAPAQQTVERITGSAESPYGKPRLAGSVVNLGRTIPATVALAVFLVCLAVVGVGHEILVDSQRRRREFATLAALGMCRRQLKSILRWQALTTGAAAVVVGIPVGLAAARVIWRALVADLGLIDDPTTPLLAIGVVAPASLVLVLATAAWPTHQMVRLRSQDLRAE